MKVTCSCGATWSGARVEHCAAKGCHQTFSGTSAGDKHRTGKHGVEVGPHRRRCLSVEEMRSVRIEKGAREGELWFEPKPNGYGTIVWHQSGEKPVPGKLEQDSAATESDLDTPIGVS